MQIRSLFGVIWRHSFVIHWRRSSNEYNKFYFVQWPHRKKSNGRNIWWSRWPFYETSPANPLSFKQYTKFSKTAYHRLENSNAAKTSFFSIQNEIDQIKRYTYTVIAQNPLINVWLGHLVYKLSNKKKYFECVLTVGGTAYYYYISRTQTGTNLEPTNSRWFSGSGITFFVADW